MSVFSSILASFLRPKFLQKHVRLICTGIPASGVISSETTDVVGSSQHSVPPSTPKNVVVLGVKTAIFQNNAYELCDNPIPEDCEIVRKVSGYSPHMTPPRAWLHSFESPDHIPSTAVELNPELFACHPRMDFLHQCKEWQEKYREVDYSWAPTRGEMGRGRRRPWGRQGIGRSRHTSKVGPQWKGGAIAHGPRGPRALFQKINTSVRLGALTSALTIKHCQNRLLIVNDFNIPSPEPSAFQNALSKNQIEDESALLVFAENENLDETSNVFAAVKDWRKINLMPLIALNVWSLLHHDWLVLTNSALEDLENKVTWHLLRYDWIDKPHNYYRDLPFEVKNSIPE